MVAEVVIEMLMLMPGIHYQVTYRCLGRVADCDYYPVGCWSPGIDHLVGYWRLEYIFELVIRAWN
jgi:hypothetical protein